MFPMSVLLRIQRLKNAIEHHQGSTCSTSRARDAPEIARRRRRTPTAARKRVTEDARGDATARAAQSRARCARTTASGARSEALGLASDERVDERERRARGRSSAARSSSRRARIPRAWNEWIPRLDRSCGDLRREFEALWDANARRHGGGRYRSRVVARARIARQSRPNTETSDRQPYILISTRRPW